MGFQLMNFQRLLNGLFAVLLRNAAAIPQPFCFRNHISNERKLFGGPCTYLFSEFLKLDIVGLP